MGSLRCTWLLIPLLALVLSGCGSNSELVGRWEKVARPTPTPNEEAAAESVFAGLAAVFADAMYPAKIEFFNDGTYTGTPGSLLGGGDYEVVEGTRLKLRTVTGMSVYEFSISGSSFSLRDENGAEVTYQRAP